MLVGEDSLLAGYPVLRIGVLPRDREALTGGSAPSESADG